MKWRCKNLNRSGSVFRPHTGIGLLTFIIASLFLRPFLLQLWHSVPTTLVAFSGWKSTIDTLGLLTLPQAVLGIALVLMSIGLFLRARVAWAFSLLLVFVVAVLNFMLATGIHKMGYLALLDCLLLLWFQRDFGHSSLAAGTLFALISIASLLMYALCGTLYLGDQFRPPVNDLPTALYFSTVSMSTVGFGDIIPVTASSRLFTVSIIIMGITVFATSISAIIGPVIGGNLKRIIKGKITKAMRKHHIIIIGATPLARSVYNGLTERNEMVTVIVPPGITHDYPKDADLIIGDAASDNALYEAGADKARYILVLRDDDSDNAFIVLAAKEVVSEGTHILALVNSDKHFNKMKRVQPDIIFSLQTLASEMLLRKLSGDNTKTDNLVALLFPEH